MGKIKIEISRGKEKPQRVKDGAFKPMVAPKPTGTNKVNPNKNTKDRY